MPRTVNIFLAAESDVLGFNVLSPHCSRNRGINIVNQIKHKKASIKLILIKLEDKLDSKISTLV